MTALRVLGFVAGAVVVAATLGSAVRTVVLPRAVPARLTRFVFLGMRAVFRLRARPKLPYLTRDRIMALYAPVSLLALIAVWLTLVVLGYTLMYLGVGDHGFADSFRISGSSVTTLGFERPGNVATAALAFTEAALGLTLLALLITYLPSVYGVFSQREAQVATLEVRAGSPPSAVEMIERYCRIRGLEELAELWPTWETWFVSIAETHTSFPAVVFFRSPVPEHSWVTAAGTVLDAASLRASTLDLPPDPRAELCIRAGYIALRRIATYFGIPFDPDPAPTDPISIERDEFDEAYERMRANSVPIKPDRDRCWRDFAAWRVNYDAVLIPLAGLVMAPIAPWSSDRSIRSYRPPLLPLPRRRYPALRR